MTKPTASSHPILPGSPCPCGSGQTFAACCEPFLLGRSAAPTAEVLMRSRFTAHVVGNFAYLHRTYLPTAKLPFQPEEENEELDWTRLVVHAHEDGPRPDLAFVDFSAYFQHESGERVLHEKAEFQRIGGVWYYTRAVRIGPAPVKSAHPKVGRNDPCPCGSGKKYKQCCLRVA